MDKFLKQRPSTSKDSGDSVRNPPPKLPRLEPVPALDVLKYDKPNQPDAKVFPVQHEPAKDGGKPKVRSFQTSWYETYPGLHYDAAIQGALCYYCARAKALNISGLATKADPTFSVDGFGGWKKALEKFSKHEKSDCHRFCIAQLKQIQTPVDTALSQQAKWAQRVASVGLHKIMTFVMFLARQGLAFRGHANDEGNFNQLVLLRSEDVPDLKDWLRKPQSFTSWKIQNEVISMLGDSIVRQIREELADGHFSVIVDGTQDCSGTEQESICLRYVDSDMMVHEEFIGLYATPDATAATLTKMVLDVLLRLNLSADKLRGQTYDGAANMSGQYTGTQARVKKVQPLALYVHCGAHCVNLVANHGVTQSAFVTDCVNLVHEVGTLYGRSSKMRRIFADLSSQVDTSSKVLKPLCPTRWTVRTPAIIQLLSMYEAVCDALEELCGTLVGAPASHARGLLHKLEDGNTILGLKIALAILEPLESLNTALQGRSQTVSGMLSAVGMIKAAFAGKRNNESFHGLLLETGELIEKHALSQLSISRRRRPPSRFSGSAPAHEFETPEEYYRTEYYKIIDGVILQLNDRFDQPDLAQYEQLTTALLTGQTNSVTEQYPQFTHSLKSQLQIFRSQNEYGNIADAVDIFLSFPPEAQRMFQQVQQLIRLCLVIPASSCEAERSFSGLRRLKTWLRSTMKQSRLSCAAVCNCHQERLDRLDVKTLVMEFVSRHDSRRSIFGH